MHKYKMETFSVIEFFPFSSAPVRVGTIPRHSVTIFSHSAISLRFSSVTLDAVPGYRPQWTAFSRGFIRKCPQEKLVEGYGREHLEGKGHGNRQHDQALEAHHRDPHGDGQVFHPRREGDGYVLPSW